GGGGRAGDVLRGHRRGRGGVGASVPAAQEDHRGRGDGDHEDADHGEHARAGGDLQIHRTDIGTATRRLYASGPEQRDGSLTNTGGVERALTVRSPAYICPLERKLASQRPLEHTGRFTRRCSPGRRRTTVTASRGPSKRSVSAF